MATVSEVIQTHLKLRDYIDERQKALDEEMKPLKHKLQVMENWLHAELDREGLQNFSVKDVGVAFKKKASTCTVGDWDATLTFILDGEHYDMLNHAVNKTAVEEWIETNKAPPPGVNYSAFMKLHVQRARAT